MIERKFNKAAIIISALAVLSYWFLGIYSFIPVILGIIAIIIAVGKRETHLVKLPVFLSVIAIIMGIFDLLLFHTDLFFSF
ncbi:MAG: hypothetical protein IKK66_11040 [Ruminococcus sp.]|nr:hypothetical protein [Ruminococcus sp.]